MELTSAAFGGGKSSEKEVGIDTGQGLDDLTDEQIEEMKAILGEKDFNAMYGHLL